MPAWNEFFGLWEPEKFAETHEEACAALSKATKTKGKQKKGRRMKGEEKDERFRERFKANLENAGFFPTKFPPRPNAKRYLTFHPESTRTNDTTPWLGNVLRMLLPQLQRGNDIFLRDHDQSRDPVQKNDEGVPVHTSASKRELRFSRLVQTASRKRKKNVNVPNFYKFKRKLEDLVGCPCLSGRLARGRWIPDKITNEHFTTLRVSSGLLDNGGLMKWFGGRYMVCATYLAARELLLDWGQVAESSDLVKDLDREFEDVKKREQHVSDEVITKHYATTTTTYDFTHPNHAQDFGHRRLWSHPTTKPVFSWERGVQAWPYSLCESSEEASTLLASRCHDMRRLTPNEQMQQLFFTCYVRLAFELTQRNHQLYGGADGRGAPGYKTLYAKFSCWMVAPS